MKKPLDITHQIAEDLAVLKALIVDPEESLTKAEAAHFLRVSPKQIERYMKAGLKHYEGPRFIRRHLVEFRETFAVQQHTRLRRVV